MLIENRWPSEHPDRIQLYSMNTPNGVKVAAALEELQLPYEPHLIDITNDDQFTEEFISISPNSKIPAIVDPHGPNGQPIAMMESGAILMHLADKTGKLLSADPAARNECLQWLFFQVGHIGPMFGQFGHFYKFATEKCPHPYPTQRYSDEAKRLLGVLDRRLDGRDYIMGDEYTIADIATFPWVRVLGGFYGAGEHLAVDTFAHVGSWLARCEARPASQKAQTVCARS